jgi:hypothetical protein
VSDFRADSEIDGIDGRRSLMPFLLLTGLAFVLGLAAMGWILANWGAAARFLGVAPLAPPAAVAQAEAAPAEQALLQPQTPQQQQPAPKEGERILLDPELQRRVAQLEQRLAAIGNVTRTAVGSADRAEGLLVAFAARRALDRGVPLGYIEGLLRQRFGNSQPQAVGMIITAARNPVTLEELREGLREVGPAMAGAPPNQGWWRALRNELGTLITVRREGTPSTVPADRLRRAQQRLETGQVDVALAEVLRLPGRENGAEWIQAARRYVLARRALDLIETAALLDPQNPPQPEPAAAAPAPAAAAPAR